MSGPRLRARCPECRTVMVVIQRTAHVEELDGPLQPDGTVPFTYPAHPPGGASYCDGWGRRVDAADLIEFPPLTPAQQDVIDFLGRVGHATWLTVSEAMWGRRRKATAEGMLSRLAGMGVVLAVPWRPGVLRYELTPLGRAAATEETA